MKQKLTFQKIKYFLIQAGRFALTMSVCLNLFVGYNLAVRKFGKMSWIKRHAILMYVEGAERRWKKLGDKIEGGIKSWVK